MADRAVAPAVGKALEIGLVLVYVALLASALYGYAVPSYRADAGTALADRTLSAATLDVEDAVPDVGRHVDVRVRVPLPDTIRGRSYEVRADGRALVLDHSSASVGGRQRLALPERVVAVEGAWRSEAPAFVHVRGNASALVVDLEAETG